VVPLSRATGAPVKEWFRSDFRDLHVCDQPQFVTSYRESTVLIPALS